MEELIKMVSSKIFLLIKIQKNSIVYVNYVNLKIA